MSESTKARVNVGLLWTILVTMLGGVYQAGQVREQLSSIAVEIKRVRTLEERVLRIETKMGIVTIKENVE